MASEYDASRWSHACIGVPGPPEHAGQAVVEAVCCCASVLPIGDHVRHGLLVNGVLQACSHHPFLLSAQNNCRSRPILACWPAKCNAFDSLLEESQGVNSMHSCCGIVLWPPHLQHLSMKHDSHSLRHNAAILRTWAAQVGVSQPGPLTQQSLCPVSPQMTGTR
jgi:hypothetical protein